MIHWINFTDFLGSLFVYAATLDEALQVARTRFPQRKVMQTHSYQNAVFIDAMAGLPADPDECCGLHRHAS